MASGMLMVGLSLCLALRYTHHKPYEVADLGTLGGPNSRAFALNDKGQVVGQADTPDRHSHAFLWEGGHMIDLVAPGVEGSCACSINNRGQIVGTTFIRSRI